MRKNNTLFRKKHSQMFKRMLIAGLLWGMSVGASAATNTLKSIHAVSSGDGNVTLRLVLSRAAPKPSVFSVARPARLSVDLPNTAIALKNDSQQINRGPVESITAAKGRERSRLVIKLTRMVPYRIDRSGRVLSIHLGDRYGSDGVKGHSSHSHATAVKNIDFRRGPKGSGRIDITLDGTGANVNVKQKNGRVIAHLNDIKLPARLRKRLVVTDFATPVKTIDAYARGNDTRIVVTPEKNADYERIAYQTGQDFYIALQPKVEKAKQKQSRHKQKFSGKKISLSFQSIKIRKVLQIIADVANVNMVVSDSVHGTMALRLQNVPWDQALDIILKAKGLGMERRNNVITVAPLAEIAERKKAEERAQQASNSVAPLQSTIIQINYAQSSDIAELIRSKSEAGTENHSLLSKRGQITVDQRTNSLLIDDTQPKLRKIRHVISQLDIPVRQVLIQSRIVIANRNFSRNLGSEFSVRTANNEPGTFAGSNRGSGLNQTGSPGQQENGGFSVDLPASNPAGSLAASIITGHTNVALILSALETENRGEIISSPRVITANSQKASISQGTQIPYLQAASSGAATVQFKNAVLKLAVTPQITPDDHVIMDLDVKQDSVGQRVSVQGGGQVPSIDTRRLNTRVLVGNGDTVVLGGIYEQTDKNQSDRIPILGELPLIGHLFNHSQRTHNKRELLLFVTPKIIKQELNLH